MYNMTVFKYMIMKSIKPTCNIAFRQIKPGTWHFDILASSAGIHRYVTGRWNLVLSWSKLGTRYGKVRQLKYYCNIFLSVNPIFVVICGPKQSLQNRLLKASFKLFIFFKNTNTNINLWFWHCKCVIKKTKYKSQLSLLKGS